MRPIPRQASGLTREDRAYRRLMLNTAGAWILYLVLVILLQSALAADGGGDATPAGLGARVVAAAP